MGKRVAQRIENGIEKFIQTVSEFGNLSYSDAEKVYIEFKNSKVLKFDFVNGTVSVKHGVFWDKQIFKNAINQFNERDAK